MSDQAFVTDYAFLSVGIVVAAFGTLLIFWHVRQHRKHQENLELSVEDQRFFDGQYRRRIQTSALTVTLGALLSLCENLPAFRTSPIFATFYVMGLLLLAFWLVLLALSDAIASRVHVSQSLRRNRRARQSLSDAIEELRSAQQAQWSDRPPNDSKK
jgi:hypothetical protein